MAFEKDLKGMKEPPDSGYSKCKVPKTEVYYTCSESARKGRREVTGREVKPFTP